MRIPRHQIGYVLPVLVSDYIHYQFYRVVPDECLFVCRPFAARDFSAAAADDAVAPFRECADFLSGRGVVRICQAGIPMSANWGRAKTRALMQETAERHPGVVVEADFEDAIAALGALGARRIAVGAKWDKRLIGRVADYLADAGLAPVSTCGDPHEADEVVRITPAAGVEMALSLGRRAFAAAPDADALLLAGGSWLSLAAIPLLEAEFGRPVITNPTATYWAVLRQLALTPVTRGFGRLIDALSE